MRVDFVIVQFTDFSRLGLLFTLALFLLISRRRDEAGRVENFARTVTIKKKIN